MTREPRTANLSATETIFLTILNLTPERLVRNVATQVNVPTGLLNLAKCAENDNKVNFLNLLRINIT
jgi:hypothetical protein